MSRRGQLRAMIRYVHLNPQRLATKRLMPGFFRVQGDIVLASRNYSGVGNIALLQAEHYAAIHVRHELVDAVADGRVLILSPWPYEANKRRISRTDCIALNTMAEEIAGM